MTCQKVVSERDQKTQVTTACLTVTDRGIKVTN